MEDERVMHKATCAECGNECEVPFEPTKDKPVYCMECFKKRKPRRSFQSRGRFNDRFGRQERRMYKATCAECNKECEVPFKPMEGKPVYCRECYSQRQNN